MSLKVAILLGTYQGERYLNAQVESFFAQTHQNWQLWTSDDGSCDQTLSIVAQYHDTRIMEVLCGPRQGFARNFLSLVNNPTITADYYAYSDQDDIWQADKLARALNFLHQVPGEMPALYCSRTTLIDENNQVLGMSKLCRKSPSFANALVQNIASGNTMVFNNATRDVLRNVSHDIDVPYHDWWTYLIISAYGGKIYYDSYPTVAYRQHRDNLIGANLDWRSLLRRIYLLNNGLFRRDQDVQLCNLQQSNICLSAANQQVLQRFVQMRRASWLIGWYFLWRSGVYRQTMLENIGLFVAVIFKKV